MQGFKQRFVMNKTANKSLDVRAKQRLWFHEFVKFYFSPVFFCRPRRLSPFSIKAIFRHVLHRIFDQHIDDGCEVLIIFFPDL